MILPEYVAVEMGHVILGGAVDMGGLIEISSAPPCHSSYQEPPPRGLHVHSRII